MSTFTTIKTAIRDAVAMHRVLQAIPGARINSGVTLPLKAGGYGRFEFMVELAGGGGGSSILAALFGRGLRFFAIYRDTDGTLTIEINQEQQGARNIESQVAAALRHHKQMLAAEDLRRAQQREEERERILRMVEEERQRLSREHPQTKRVPTQELEAPKLSEAARRAEEERARKEAEAILAQFDSKRTAAAPPSSATPATSDPGVHRELNHLLSQQYAKEKVMEQVSQIEQQYGVRLAGEEVFQDGTIEITLRG